MNSDQKPTTESFAALRERFQEQSRKAQAYYAVMHEARRLVGSDEAASAWMTQALASLGGRTPDELVGAGREQEVLAHLRSLREG